MAKKPIKPPLEPTPATPGQQEQFDADQDRGESAADIKPSDAISDERGPSGADINQQQ